MSAPITRQELPAPRVVLTDERYRVVERWVYGDTFGFSGIRLDHTCVRERRLIVEHAGEEDAMGVRGWEAVTAVSADVYARLLIALGVVDSLNTVGDDTCH